MQWLCEWSTGGEGRGGRGDVAYGVDEAMELDMSRSDV